MKIETTIDCGVLDDGCVEEAVFNQIVDTIVERISEAEIEKIKRIAADRIAERIDEKVEALYEEFMDREVVLHDRYGDRCSTYPNVRALIKDRFDKYINEKVDDRGVAGRYDSKWTRLEYVTRNQIEEQSNEFTKQAVDEVAKRIKSYLNEDLKAALGSKLVEILDLNKLFKHKK